MKNKIANETNKILNFLNMQKNSGTNLVKN